MAADKDFGFADAMSDELPPMPAPKPASPTVDLSGFDDPEPPQVDRQAAETAREVSRAHGFTSRSPRAPRSAPKAEKPTKAKGRVRMAEIAPTPPPEARADEPRAQLNINAPVSVVRRFKELERRRGIRAWQLLEAMLDLAETAEAKRK